MAEELTIEPLNAEHHTNWFDCGDTRLEKWLNNQALKDHQLGRSKTFVWVEDDLVVGYFTLLQAQVEESKKAPQGVKNMLPKGYPKSAPVPAILLAKLAIDQKHQGAGKGLELLAEALLVASDASRMIGGVFFLVDPAEGKPWLRGYYESNGFLEAEGTDRMYMVLSHD